MAFERDFGCDRMLEGFRQCIRAVKNTAVVNVGDGHRDLLSFGFTTWRFNRDTAFPCNTADGDFGQPLEEGIIEATCILGANGACQHGCSRVRGALTLQAAHVGTERSQHVTCGRMVHGKPLAPSFVLHRPVLLCKMIHHGIGWGSSRIVRDGGSTGSEWIGTRDARTPYTAGEGGAGVCLRHVGAAEGANRCARPPGLRLEALVRHALRRHALLRKPLRRHALLRHALLRHLAVTWLHHALRRHALLRHALGWHALHALRRKALLRHALWREVLPLLLLRESTHRGSANVRKGGGGLTGHSGGSTALAGAALWTKHRVIRNGFPARRALHGATSSNVRRLAP